MFFASNVWRLCLSNSVLFITYTKTHNTGSPAFYELFLCDLASSHVLCAILFSVLSELHRAVSRGDPAAILSAREHLPLTGLRQLHEEHQRMFLTSPLETVMS